MASCVILHQVIAAFSTMKVDVGLTKCLDLEESLVELLIFLSSEAFEFTNACITVSDVLLALFCRGICTCHELLIRCHATGLVLDRLLDHRICVINEVLDHDCYATGATTLFV